MEEMHVTRADLIRESKRQKREEAERRAATPQWQMPLFQYQKDLITEMTTMRPPAINRGGDGFLLRSTEYTTGSLYQLADVSEPYTLTIAKDVCKLTPDMENLLRTFKEDPKRVDCALVLCDMVQEAGVDYEVVDKARALLSKENLRNHFRQEYYISTETETYEQQRRQILYQQMSNLDRARWHVMKEFFDELFPNQFDCLTAFTRNAMREEGFMRRIMEPQEIPDDELCAPLAVSMSCTVTPV